MTRAIIETSGGRIVGFEISGHSGYSESGSDIVCAGVSALAQTALMGLVELLKLEPSYRIDEATGLLRLDLPESTADAQLILKTMELGLSSIQKQYPKHFRMTHRERR